MSPYLFILNTHCGVTFSLSQSFEWTGSQSAFDVAAKNTSSSAILDTDRRPPVVCQFCWECASHTNDVICPNVTQVRAERPAELFFPFFRSIKQRQAQSYGGPQLSWQNRKPHGKTKTSRQKQNTSRQKQKPHGKNKSTLGPAHADVVMRRTGKRDEVHVCLRG